MTDSKKLYSSGIHYDLVNNDVVFDIPFYKHMAAEAGNPILEMACGTGRITIPLAEEGFDITGIDISKSMLQHAQKKSEKLTSSPEFIKADCRQFNLNKTYKMIYLPFNSIAHLHTLSDLEDCFSCVQKHMHKNGIFIVSIFNPSLEILTRSREHLYHVTQYPHPEGKGTVTLREINHYDAKTQINYITWYYFIDSEKDPVYSAPLNMRMFFPQELDLLMKHHGFKIIDKYGDFNKTAFKSDSIHQILVCKMA